MFWLLSKYYARFIVHMCVCTHARVHTHTHTHTLDGHLSSETGLTSCPIPS